MANLCHGRFGQQTDVVATSRTKLQTKVKVWLHVKREEVNIDILFLDWEVVIEFNSRLIQYAKLKKPVTFMKGGSIIQMLSQYQTF